MLQLECHFMSSVSGHIRASELHDCNLITWYYGTLQVKTNKSTITGLRNVIPLQVHYLQEGEESRKAYIFHQGLLGITISGHQGIGHQQWVWCTSFLSPSWKVRRCLSSEDSFNVNVVMLKSFTLISIEVCCTDTDYFTGAMQMHLLVHMFYMTMKHTQSPAIHI